MRREDTPSFLSHFLGVRAAPLLESFREWATASEPILRGRRARADHLSYKCREFREYAEIRGRFEEYTDGWRGCRFLYQSVISGRRVAVIGLIDPIPTPIGEIRVLELSEPKPMSADAGGFDHVEVYPTLGTVEGLAHALAAAGTPFKEKRRPHHTTLDAVIRADASRDGRQDFILRLTDGPLVVKIGQEMP